MLLFAIPIKFFIFLIAFLIIWLQHTNWDNHSDSGAYQDVPHTDSHDNWSDHIHSDWIAYLDTPTSDWDQYPHDNVSGEHVDEPALL